MTRLLALVCLLFTSARTALAQCPGCYDISAPDPTIPSLDLKSPTGFFGGQSHYATVTFAVRHLNTWDGSCWQALIDFGIYQCFEEYPCTYEREIVASYTNGPDAVTGEMPRFSVTGADCTGPFLREQFMVLGPGVDHQVWKDLWGVACHGGCTIGLTINMKYGTPLGGGVYRILAPPTTTSFSHLYRCEKCF